MCVHDEHVGVLLQWNYACLSLHLLAFRERYSKPSWLPEVPSHAKLNESDIDCFVKCLLPTVQLAMFNKMTALYAASTFHNLALIRSDLVLPRLLER